LVHVSEIAHKYIQDPSEVLKLNQHVKVKVMEVDVARKRIALSIKQTEAGPVIEAKKSTHYPNKPKQKVFQEPVKKTVPETMDDALAALKNKFR
jgi:protein Tex